MDREQTYIKALGQAVRELRKAKGFSQESFADAVGLHRTYMGAIERGEQNLTIKNIVKVSDTLGIEPSKLLTEAENLLQG
jgi:transcriptional regulator with XRE-family HTH domain